MPSAVRTRAPAGAPAAAQSAAFAAGMLRITGVLLQDAEHRHTAGQQSHALVLAIISTGAGLPYEVRQDLGTTPSSHIAAADKARLLRRGAHVTAVAHGALPRSDHGLAVLALQGVTDLIAHNLPQPAGLTGEESTP